MSPSLEGTGLKRSDELLNLFFRGSPAVQPPLLSILYPLDEAVGATAELVPGPESFFPRHQTFANWTEGRNFISRLVHRITQNFLIFSIAGLSDETETLKTPSQFSLRRENVTRIFLPHFSTQTGTSIPDEHVMEIFTPEELSKIAGFSMTLKACGPSPRNTSQRSSNIASSSKRLIGKTASMSS